MLARLERRQRCLWPNLSFEGHEASIFRSHRLPLQVSYRSYYSSLEVLDDRKRQA